MRKRESSCFDALSTTHETRTRRGFTIDFTSYKVFIIRLCLWISSELYALYRERAPWRGFKNARTETRVRRGFTIDFTFYKVIIIMLMADLCYIPKIACMFSKPYEVRKLFELKYAYCWTNMTTIIFEKETSKSNMTVSNNSQYRALHLNMKLLVIANLDITKWLQSQASLSSHVYTLNACVQNNQSSWCCPKYCFNQSDFFFTQSSFSWSIFAITAEYWSNRLLLHITLEPYSHKCYKC